MGTIICNMLLEKVTFVIALVIASTQAEQTWYNLKTTWGPTPLQGFNDQPRTVEEANNAGWVQVSNDCSEVASFPGNLMAPSGENPEMVFISDVFSFDASKWYRSISVLGEDAFVTTAYFVDPAIICQGGRSQEQFDMEGTGNRVWFQNGATTA